MLPAFSLASQAPSWPLAREPTVAFLRHSTLVSQPNFRRFRACPLLDGSINFSGRRGRTDETRSFHESTWLWNPDVRVMPVGGAPRRALCPRLRRLLSRPQRVDA